MLILGTLRGARSERGVATMDVHCLGIGPGVGIRMLKLRRKGLLPGVVFEATSKTKITLKRLTIRDSPER